MGVDMRLRHSRKYIMAVTELNESNFEDTVSGGGIVLVDFWAPWCGPCKLIAPVVESVADAVKDKAAVAKVNVDENEALARKYGIMSIPSLYVFKNGRVVDKMIGLPHIDAKKTLINLIERNY